jgi:hypothetical protein
MDPPTLTAVTESQIDLSWTDVTTPANGNSDITLYSLYWDNGSGTSNIVLLEALQTTIQVTGLTGATTYKFKVKARNIYGSGEFSTELAVLASDIPDKMAIPTVTIAPTATQVVISWSEPDDHSATIDAYAIEFLKSDGTYEEDTIDGNCNGADPAVVSAL